MRNDMSDALFEARINEIALRAEQYVAGYSGFLSPKEQRMAREILARKKADCVSFFFGGYDGSERNRLFALPDYMAEEGEYGASLVRACFPELVEDAVVAVRIQGSGYRKLCHRDYLGSLLGLGVERDAVGDIALLDDFSAVVFCDGAISRLVLLELKKIGNDSVKTEIFDVPADFSNAPRLQPVSDTVASARFDCVVSALAGISRERAQSAIRGGLAELDYFTEERPDRGVSEGSIISVRGYGKFIVTELSEQTKKGRLRLKASKYI